MNAKGLGGASRVSLTLVSWLVECLHVIIVRHLIGLSKQEVLGSIPSRWSMCTDRKLPHQFKSCYIATGAKKLFSYSFLFVLLTTHMHFYLISILMTLHSCSQMYHLSSSPPPPPITDHEEPSTPSWRAKHTFKRREPAPIQCSCVLFMAAW